MLQILVGVIVGYDQAAGLARIKLRGPVESGDLVRIVGGHTNKELKLDGAQAHSSSGQEFDARMQGVEPGDMVLRLVTPAPVAA